MKKRSILLLFVMIFSYVGSIAQNLPMELINNSEFPTNQIYWCVLGSRIGDDRLCYVDLSNGQLKETSEAHNGQLTKNGEGYPDYFYPVSSTSLTSLPKMHGARIFISMGEKMYLKIIGNGYAGVNLANPNDPNAGIRHEIIEFTNDDAGYHGNTTRVDQFSYPISMRLTAANDYDKIVGEYISFDEIFTQFKNSAPVAFQGCVDEATQMILAPGKTGTFSSTYFDSYLTHIWTKYRNEDLFFKSDAGSFTGRVQADGRFIFRRASDNMPAVISRKPTTIEVLEGSGVLAEWVGINGDASPAAEKTLSMVVQALFCAAVNRHVVEEASWSKSSKFYLQEPCNFYSKFWHSEGIAYGQLAYGFCYDDVFGQSTLLESANPTKLYIYMGGGGSDDPTGGNTNGALAKPNVGGAYACSGSETTTVNNNIDFNYSFVPSGNSVIVTFQATTPKDGYVPVLLDKTSGMVEETIGSGTTVSATITAEPGENVIVTGKWMFAGGDAFTKDFVYQIGSGCGDPGDDTQAPTSPSNLQVSSVTQTDVNLTWTASTDNVGVTGYKVYRGTTYIKTVTTNSASITGLTAETAYTFNVSAIDAAGNESAKASVSTTTLKEGQVGDSSCAGTSTDAVDGTFSNGYKYEFTTTGTTVTVNFEMLDVKEGLVAYAFTYNPNFAEYPMTQGSGQKFSKTFTGQTAGSTFKVACKFAFAGGLAVTKTFEYTVGDLCGGDTPGDDTEAPTSPSNLQVSSVSQTDVNLTWTSSTDNVGVVGYKIYNGITYIKTVATNTANITGLTSATSYTFNVSAIDAAGNESVKASVATTTLNEGEIGNSTCAGAATDAVEGEFSLGYNYQFSTSGTDVTVTFELLDSKVGLVAFAFTYNPDFAEVQMTNVSGNKFSATFPGQTLGSTFKVACKFAFAGGLAVTKTFNYTVGDNCIITDIQDKKTNSSVIYPNPAKEYVFIHAQEDSKVSVYDMQGRLVYSDKVLSGETVLNLNNYKSGMYVVKISGNSFSNEMLLKKE